MKQTINFSDFRDAFQKIRPDNFSYEGQKALFEYLESLEEDGEEFELDVIAFCCDYTEYASLYDFHKDYDEDDFPTIEDIEEHTTVIRFGNGSFIVNNDF